MVQLVKHGRTKVIGKGLLNSHFICDSDEKRNLAFLKSPLKMEE